MRKYGIYWPIIVLILIVVINVIHGRPRALEDIIATTPDSVSVNITDWDGATHSTLSKKMTPNEFCEVIRKMHGYKYRKVWRNNTHSSERDTFYFITFEINMKNNQEEQIITLSKDGFVKVNKNYYSITTDDEEGMEMVDEVYNYIYTIIDE